MGEKNHKNQETSSVSSDFFRTFGNSFILNQIINHRQCVDPYKKRCAWQEIVFSFWWIWGLNSGFHAWKASTLRA
jgi:hypothetical protein